INRYELPDNTGYIEVIAGEYNGVKGSASTFTPVNLQNAKVKAGAKVEYSFPSNYNTALLVIEGSIKVNGTETAPADHFVLMDNNAEGFYFEALENAI